MTTTSLGKENTERANNSRIIGLWRRLPVLVRDIAARLFVFLVSILLSGLLGKIVCWFLTWVSGFDVGVIS